MYAHPALAAVIIALILIGSASILASAIAMFRQRDALSKINCLGPCTAAGLPLMAIGAYLDDLGMRGFSVYRFVAMLVTLGSLIVVSAIATNVLARAAYLSGAWIDPDTDPQDLSGRDDSA